MPAPEPIAIVGIGCRFPGADGPEAFWRLVRDGIDAITDIPAGRFDADALYDASPGARGKIVTRQGGFLREIDRFDPAFFGISPREAACIDPQQRLLLEVAWEAFEDAGVTQERLAGSATGVFVGMWTSEYEGQMFGASPDIDLYVTTGGGRYAASGRLSYTFDLRGPSLTLDTACSSSLVAVHLACQSLRSGESEMALAGGVNLILEPHITIGYSRSAMLSADGRCRFGDARASGYVRSEGVGLVLLKPLSRALADHDPIHALIRGSAVNNDGQGSGLLVAPSPAVQAAMLRQAYRAAGVEPGRVGYVEAHGTGTRVGDPVELTALGEVLGEGRAPGRPCLIGSVKTNIGHAEAASGIAGLIKAAFCLEHRLIPASLHLVEPNPRIPWDRLPLVIAGVAQPWPDAFTPAFAGVNSFGVTGTNAHVVLEAAPATPIAPAEPDCATANRARFLPLTARSPESLRALAERWGLRLERETPPIDVDDVCYTASLRRTHHEHRLGVVAPTARDLAERLRAHVKGDATAGLVVGRTADVRPRVVFVFPGMGTQLVGLGRTLLETEPVFRDALEGCARALAPHVSWSLLDELAADGARSQLDRVDVMQPALFAVEIALAALWRQWGVVPDAVVGHSMGEVAAAHVAGALSLPDAARVIALRSRLLGSIAGKGAMAVVELSLVDAGRALVGREDRLCAAAANSARSTVISGDIDALDELLANLERRGIFCRRLKVDVAFHSPQIDPLCPELEAGLQGIVPRTADAAFYSTVTAAATAGDMLGAGYWVRNLRDPVLFAPALERLATNGFNAFIETSFHPVLLVAVQEVLQRAGTGGVGLPSGRRGDDEQTVMLESLAALWVRGYPIDWTRFSVGRRRVVPLPGYPWQRERFWYEARRPRAARAAGDHPFLTTHLTPASADLGADVWEGTIVRADHPCLPSEGAATTVSASVCLETVLWAASRKSSLFALEDVSVPEEFPLGDDAGIVQLTFRPTADERQAVELYGRSCASAAWGRLVRAALVYGSAGCEAPGPLEVETIRARTDEADVDAISAWACHAHRPPLAGVRRGDGEALGQLHETADSDACAMHPERLEAGLHVLAIAVGAEEDAAGWRIASVRRARAHAPLTAAVWVHATASPGDADRTSGDVWFLDRSGIPVLELQGVEIRRRITRPLQDLLSRVRWHARSRPAGSSRSSGRWLIVSDPDTEPGAQLVAGLEARGEACVVLPSAALLESGVDATLLSPGLPFVGCVHLASVNLDPQASPTEAVAADVGWAGALALVQALARRTDNRPPRLWLITRGAQCPTGADRSMSLGAAAIWGLGAVAAYEHPALQVTRVDLGLDSGSLDVVALVDELLSADSEDQIAVRDGARYVARLSHAAADDGELTGVDGTPPIASDSAYLITGGTGGLGLVMARWLVARGARHLTLMGRRPSSPEVDRALDQLRATGANVRIARGDVTRADDVRRIVAEASASRPLRGIIHAAGFVEDGVLANLDRERFAGVMAAKVDGALHLDAATRELRLDFFVCFSSAVGVLGSPGQGNYAAANACLDAFATRRRAEGRPTLSIAWGPWARVGMAAARRDRGQRLAARGLGSLAPEEGLDALGRLLGSSAASVLVMRFDPARWVRAHISGARSLLRELQAPAPSAAESASMLARLRAAAPEERRVALETHLREHVAHVLRVAPSRIDRATSLKNLGLNSLMSLELRNRIEVTLGLTLPATLVWNYPTVAAMAAHLVERLGLASGPDTGQAEIAGEPELEQLLAEIQGLSDDEVRRLLAEGRTGARDE